MPLYNEAAQKFICFCISVQKVLGAPKCPIINKNFPNDFKYSTQHSAKHVTVAIPNKFVPSYYYKP